jgi:hypothetical protein
MPSTYTLIKGETIGSTAASYTFSAIPSTYTDLVIRASLKTDSTATSTYAGWLKFNGTGSNSYSVTRLNTLSNSSSAVYSDRSSNANEIQSIIINSSNALFTNVFNSSEFYIPSYTASQNKPVSLYSVAEMNNTTGYDLSSTAAGLWRNTAAITSIGVFPLGGTNFASGSSFYLYGIKNS